MSFLIPPAVVSFSSNSILGPLASQSHGCCIYRNLSIEAGSPLYFCEEAWGAEHEWFLQSKEEKWASISSMQAAHCSKYAFPQGSSLTRLLMKINLFPRVRT